MELKPGYKQTEVGVIPEDWDLKALGELCIKVQDGNYGFDYPKSHEFLSFGVPFITSKAIGKDGVLRTELIDYISEEKHSQLKKAHIQLNDILFTNRGASVGAIGYVDSRIDGGNIGPQLTLLRVESDAMCSEYLFQIMQSGMVQRQILSQDSGSAMNFFGIGETKKFLLPVPGSKEEQRAIATALSDVDGLLDGLGRLIAKKRDLKQAAMQQLLTGKTRLPGVEGEWEVKRLGELCTLKSGEGITAKSIDDASPFPCYGGNGLRGFTARFTHEGDYCLIGRVGALCGNLLKVSGQFFASEHAIVATAFEDVDVGWLTLALGTLNLNRRSESSAQPVLTVSKLLPLEVFAPSKKEEQTAIATVLSDMDAEIAALEQRRNKTKDIKQAMMQELLTGKTRLI